MRIVFFVHCFFPEHFYGTETYTLALAKHYQAVGHDVVVVTAVFQGEPARADVVTRYEYQGIPVVCIDKNRLPHTRVKETYYQPDMRPILERVLRETRPDIVHVTHLINHTAALLEITLQLGIPTYATFTDFFGFCLNNKLEAANGDLCAGPSPSRTNCMACHLKDAARSPYADRWIQSAGSPRLAQWIATLANTGRRLPGLRNGPVDGLLEDIARRPDTLIGLYNGGLRAAVAPTGFLKRAYEANNITIQMPKIWFGVDIDRSPKPLRAAGHRPVVGFIGQIAPHKGTDLLIEAFTRLPRNAAELRIYGAADQDPIYMSTLRKLAGNHDVFFNGTFSSVRMAEILSEIDLIVIPSRWYENSPLVLLNALATHTPVLVSDVAGMTEFLEPNHHNLTFLRGNVDALHERLSMFIRSSDSLHELTKLINYERTQELMAQDTLKIY